VTLRKVLYGPPNWLAHRFSAEDRRMFAFWTLVVTIALLPVFGRAVLFVSIISVFGMMPNYAAETPVEEEE
jgi:hypothetical protein